MARKKKPAPADLAECDANHPQIKLQVSAILAGLHLSGSDDPSTMLAIAIRFFAVAARVCIASGAEISLEAAETNRGVILHTLGDLRLEVESEDARELLEERADWTRRELGKRQPLGRTQ